MLELRALGGLTLQGADPPLQPKRLALLTYLALARPRDFHRRDTLLALFWPELDDAHARPALRQALTALRSLDESLILTRGDEEVAVASPALVCDALAFEAALDRGELERALEVYAGPFLDGFFLTECPEFEHWVERERGRLQSLAAETAWALADRELGGNPAGAVRWARLASEFQRDDEAAVRRLITVLNGAGDRAGALREYERFAARLREEYQAEPAAETLALVEAVRLRRPAGTEGITSAQAAGPPERELDSPRLGPFYLRWREAVTLAVVVVLLLAAIGLRRRVRSPGPGGSETRIVVLPLENLGRPEDEFFADGMTEEITSRLAQVNGLAVIGRTSAMQYKGVKKGVRTIGAELKVDYVLEGSVRWSAEGGEKRLRITPQLIRVAGETDVWTERYDAVYGDVFAVQGEIADKVASALGLALGGGTAIGESAPPTRNLQAYEHFLRGNAFYAHFVGVSAGNRGAATAAVQHYEEAVRLDPGFATAWARLSLAIVSAEGGPGALVPQRAQEAATRALGLAPDLPDAHVAEGSLFEIGGPGRDLARAEAAYRRALALQPNHLEALRHLARVQTTLGNTDADLYRRLAELDPRYETGQYNAGIAYLRLRRYDEAEKYLQRYLALAPGEPQAYHRLALLQLMRNGDTVAARRVLANPVTSTFGGGFDNFRGFLEVPRFLCDHDCVRAWRDQLARRGPIRRDSLAPWHPYQVLGANARLAGDSALARANLDSAARRAEAFIVAGHRDDLHAHHDRASVLAWLGRGETALQEAHELVRITSFVRDQTVPGALTTAAEIYALFGEDEGALELLDRLLRMPSYVSVPLVRVNPVWQRFKTKPRFQALLAKYNASTRQP